MIQFSTERLNKRDHWPPGSYYPPRIELCTLSLARPLSSTCTNEQQAHFGVLNYNPVIMKTNSSTVRLLNRYHWSPGTHYSPRSRFLSLSVNHTHK